MNYDGSVINYYSNLSCGGTPVIILHIFVLFPQIHKSAFFVGKGGICLQKNKVK